MSYAITDPQTWAYILIGPMHEEKILGNPPKNTYCLVLVLFLKVGIPLVKINIFQEGNSHF